MHPLEELEYSTRVVKRAQYEAFSMSLGPDGVRVRNESHAEPADHEYSVMVEDGLPTACTCPADEHGPDACKHRVAVAIREPVLRAAIAHQAATPLVPDGGTDSRYTLGDFQPAPEDEEECEDCTEEFPCWECVRTGQRELPE